MTGIENEKKENIEYKDSNGSLPIAIVTVFKSASEPYNFVSVLKISSRLVIYAIEWIEIDERYIFSVTTKFLAVDVHTYTQERNSIVHLSEQVPQREDVGRTLSAELSSF